MHLNIQPIKSCSYTYLFFSNTYSTAYIWLQLGQIQAYMTVCSALESDGNFSHFLIKFH